MQLNPALRLRHVRCFLEVARAGSLAEAAEALHITQPAVSKTLRELEAALGAELFDRSGRRLRLNGAGRLFQRHAGAGMLELGRAQAAVRDAGAERARLSVGVLPTAATDLFPRAAIRFAAAHPRCLIHAATGPNWLLLSQLREGAADLVVGRMATPEQMTGLTFEQLYVEDVVLVSRPGHPMLDAVEPAAVIDRYPLILPPKGALISATVRGFLLSIGLHAVHPMFETVSLAFGRRAVQLSDALWFISRGVVADELASGALAAARLDHPMLAGPVGISVREDAPALSEREDLLDLLRTVAREARNVAPRGEATVCAN